MPSSRSQLSNVEPMFFSARSVSPAFDRRERIGTAEAHENNVPMAGFLPPAKGGSGLKHPGVSVGGILPAKVPSLTKAGALVEHSCLLPVASILLSLQIQRLK